MIDSGLYFTGEKSNIATSFLYVITMAHMVHMFAGLIVLIVILWKHQQKKYNSSNKLGLELGLIFWHFLDLLWLYLFLFFVFIN